MCLFIIVIQEDFSAPYNLALLDKVDSRWMMMLLHFILRLLDFFPLFDNDIEPASVILLSPSTL